jgi:phosphatidylserine/phosphatidylglycerophosphate/cardiolipin synthase-like enzyme
MRSNRSRRLLAGLILLAGLPACRLALPGLPELELTQIPGLGTLAPQMETLAPDVIATLAAPVVTRLPEITVSPRLRTPPVPGSSSTAPAPPPLTAYFTDPLAPSPDPAAALAAAIDSATLSVDMAIYNLSHPAVVESLIAAQARGVPVRLVVDSLAINEEARDALEDAGIPVIGDGRESLMHNKFTVIDRREVWTGSLNLTEDGVRADANNLVRLVDERIAADYTAEFNELFLSQFGPTSPAGSPYPVVELPGARVEVFFSPEDDPIERILPLVAGAQTSLHVLAYSFTSDELANQLIERARAGLDVRVVMDAQQAASNEGSEYPPLRDVDLVRLDGYSGLMHHKVIVIDAQVVIFGSYNFSRNAEESNDENLLVVFSPDLAAQFEAAFERVWSASE